MAIGTTTAQTPNQGPIVDLYQSVLGRAPDAAGLQFWRDSMASGTSVADIQSAFQASPEYQINQATAGLQGQLSDSKQQAINLQAQLEAAKAQQPLDQGGLGLETGLQGALSDLSLAQEQLQPYAQHGGAAYDIQAALAGAQGPEAQQQALANLQPVNDFLQQRGEQSVLRNQAAIGGLGGGNVQKSLAEFGQGLAGQSAQQQFNNLGNITGTGFSGATGLANILGNQAGARTNAGNLIASNLSSTAQNVANLRNQQGTGLSDMMGSTSSNLANILSGAGSAQSMTQQQLATLLSNMAVQQGTAAVQQQAPNVSTPNYLGQLGQITGGVGTMLQSMPQTTSPVAGYNTSGQNTASMMYNSGVPASSGTNFYWGG